MNQTSGTMNPFRRYHLQPTHHLFLFVPPAVNILPRLVCYLVPLPKLCFVSQLRIPTVNPLPTSKLTSIPPGSISRNGYIFHGHRSIPFCFICNPHRAIEATARNSQSQVVSEHYIKWLFKVFSFKPPRSKISVLGTHYDAVLATPFWKFSITRWRECGDGEVGPTFHVATHAGS